MKKGQLETLATLVGLMILTAFSGIFFSLMYSSDVRVMMIFQSVSKSIGGISLLSSMMGNPNCLSNGNFGFLKESELNSADGENELQCAYLPDLAYWVRIDDLSQNGDWEWEFGYDKDLVDDDDAKNFQFYGGIVSDSGKVRPALIDFYVIYQNNDPLLTVSSAANLAWALGEYKLRTTTMDLKFEKDGEFYRVCDKDNNKCKYLYGLKTERRSLDLDEMCFLEFEREGDVLKVEKSC